MNELEPLRKEIDQIDAEITRLLDQRFEVVLRIREIKAKNDLPVEDLAREREIISNLHRGRLEENFIREIYHLIFQYSKSFHC